MKIKTTDSDGNEITTYTGVDLTNLQESIAEKAFGGGPVTDGHCRRCREPFSEKNVFSAAGWGETKLSKLCEKCFDKMWEEV